MVLFDFDAIIAVWSKLRIKFISIMKWGPVSFQRNWNVSQLWQELNGFQS